MHGQFRAWNPYFLGVVLIGLGIVALLSDAPMGGKYGRWADPGTKKVAGVVLAAVGASSIISAARKR